MYVSILFSVLYKLFVVKNSLPKKVMVDLFGDYRDEM